MKRLAFVLLIATGCTSATPSTQRSDALLSGDATATRAADAARKAEKEDNTGLIAASSNDPAPAQAEPTSQPTVSASVLSIQIVNGVATMDGEPIADFGKVAADAVAADPAVALSITSREEVDQAKVLEITDAAKQAGITRVSVKIVIDEDDAKPDESTSKP